MKSRVSEKLLRDVVICGRKTTREYIYISEVVLNSSIIAIKRCDKKFAHLKPDKYTWETIAYTKDGYHFDKVRL